MRWVTRFVGVGALFLLVWLTVVVVWQTNKHSPSGGDLLLYLGLLPLVLAGAVWGVYKLATQTKAATSAGTGPDNGAAQLLADQAAQRAEVERTQTLCVVATSLHTAAGQSAADVLEKLNEGALEMALDSELKNDGGFPIFSARIADLDISEVQAVVAAWPPEDGVAELAWSESQYRVLQLSAFSLAELVPIAATHTGFVHQLRLLAEGRGLSDLETLRLRLMLIWPAAWSVAHRAWASQWAKSYFTDQGWPEHWVVIQDARNEQANPLGLLDRIGAGAHQRQLPTVGLLLACDSAIDQETVDAWAGAGQLFSGSNALGLRPGELAAGLLFADPAQSRLFGDVPLSTLHRASWMAHEESTDLRAGRRDSATLLNEVVVAALKNATLAPDAVKFISADHDHRLRREMELCEMMTANFPDLDPFADAVRVAQACGSTSHFTTVAALCIAHQHIVKEKTPAMCVSLHDPFLRAAVVLSAPAAPSTPPKA